MALIKCVDCGKEVSDRASICPNCGCPIECSLESAQPAQTQEPEGFAVYEVQQEMPVVPEVQTEIPLASTIQEDSAETETPAPVQMSAIIPPYSENKNASVYQPDADGEKESGKALKISVAVVMALLIVALIFGVSYFARSNKKSADNTTRTTQSTTVAPQESDNTIYYISDRSVQYDDIRQHHELFFGFKNVNNEHIIANSGTLTVKIVNMAGEQVYSGTIDFTSEDFSTWSNPSWDSERLLGCVYIKDSDITTGSSDRGILTMSAVADGVSFDDHDINIYNLPSNGTYTSHYHSYSSTVTTEATCMADGVRTFTCSCGHSYTQVEPKRSVHSYNSATCTAAKTCKWCGVTEGQALGHSYNTDGVCYRCDGTNPDKDAALSQCSLSLPVVPAVITDRRNNGAMRSSVYVTAISYEFGYSSDGISLDVKFSGTKTFDEKGDGQSDACKIGWKLYDSKGNVYKTGTFYSPQVANGESFYEQKETLLYGYQGHKPDAYRLEILDVN